MAMTSSLVSPLLVSPGFKESESPNCFQQHKRSYLPPLTVCWLVGWALLHHPFLLSSSASFINPLPVLLLRRCVTRHPDFLSSNKLVHLLTTVALMTPTTTEPLFWLFATPDVRHRSNMPHRLSINWQSWFWFFISCNIMVLKQSASSHKIHWCRRDLCYRRRNWHWQVHCASIQIVTLHVNWYDYCCWF